MTQTTETTGAVEAEAPYELTALDRCDACGAQAYIKVQMASGGELLFCAHHGRKHQEKLSEVAQSWHDESSRLLVDTRD